MQIKESITTPVGSDCITTKNPSPPTSYFGNIGSTRLFFLLL